MKPGWSELKAGAGGGGDVALAACASLLGEAAALLLPKVPDGLNENGFAAVSLLGVWTVELTPESGVSAPASFLDVCTDSFFDDWAESLLLNISPIPPKEKLPESLLPVSEASAPLLLASLSSACLFAAKAENDPCPKAEVVEPKADGGAAVGFGAVEAEEPKRLPDVPSLLVSSLPPLPKTEPAEGLEVDPKALGALAAKPPKPEPTEVELASLAAEGVLNAPNAEPGLA